MACVGAWMIFMVGMVGMAAAYPSYLVTQTAYQQCYVNVSCGRLPGVGVFLISESGVFFAAFPS